MGIQIVPYRDEHVPEVADFNRRMAEGQSPWGWYEAAVDDWIPPREGIEVWRDHFVATDDEGRVRGAYALKPQPWIIRGERHSVSDWQGPVSEGAISPRHAALGLRLIRDMLKRSPLLYSWGHGGDDATMLQLLRSLGWLIHDTPFCIRVCHPFAFLRRNRYLRGTTRNRLALDALAFTGAGSVGFRALQALRGLRRPSLRDVSCEEVDEFGAWADDLWAACHGDYLALGLRDASTMNALVPASGWPFGIRLRVRRGGQDIGWAVAMDNRDPEDPRFGDLRVGCIADVLAKPADAPVVIAAASRFLADRGVDLIGSNQSHPDWVQAFARNGYLVLENRRTLAVSPEFQAALEPFEEARSGLHLTNMDGHGPHGFGAG